jgi:Acyl-coenzyme A:6-aminopenicillanic acid acyl-transferase
MYKHNLLKVLITAFMMLLSISNAIPCSMYKITMNGKTIVGNNEDSWRLTSRIWFEKGTEGKYGAAYVGYSDKPFADGGINEYGLAWDGFTVLPRKLKDQSTKKHGFSFGDMKTIMQKCKTVDEVYSILNQNNLSSLNGSMLLFIDKAGKYLVVEADTLIPGNDPTYVLANFCPSQTKDLSAVKLGRYNRGVDFLKNKIDTSINFCTALSDTMHECRKKTGDGTLYTNIYDLNEGIIYLYFYHDFKKSVRFNIKEELAKGDHVLGIPSLFPPNAEYKKLSAYKIPQNSISITVFLFFCKGLFLFSSIFFLMSYFKKRRSQNQYVFITLLLFTVCAILLYYLNALSKNEAIFYFPAPYKDIEFSLLNIAAYIPFLILLLIVPLVRLNIKIFKETNRHIFSKYLFTINNLACLALIILFFYWGFFNIF